MNLRFMSIFFLHFSMLLWGQIDTNRCLVVLFGAFCEELAAGAADLDTACDAQSDEATGVLENADESLDVVGGRGVESVARCFVVGDDVDVVGEAEGELCESSCVVVGVVDAAEKDVFEEDFFVRSVGPIGERLADAGEWEFFVDWHEFGARFVGRRIDADGDVGAIWRVLDFGEFGQYARCRERHADGWDGESVGMG